MGKRSSKRPTDENQLARFIVDQVTGKDEPKVEAKAEDAAEGEAKNPAAVYLGRLGGLKGGKARAKKLSSERRREIARKAAQARWKSGKK